MSLLSVPGILNTSRSTMQRNLKRAMANAMHLLLSPNLESFKHVAMLIVGCFWDEALTIFWAFQKKMFQLGGHP